jgi:hypothetical protein
MFQPKHIQVDNAVGKHLPTRGRPTILKNGKERKKKEKKAIIGQIIETI